MDFYLYEGSPYCAVPNTICVYNDLGYFSIGSSPPTDWNDYFWAGSPGWVNINARTPKGNQLVGQVVWRYGRTSGLDAGAISAKPTFVTQDTCTPTFTCRNYNAIEVDLASAPGDSGSGFFRLYSGPYGDAFGILSFGKTGAGNTYYYSWDQPFYGGVNFTDQRNVYTCAAAGCPL